MLDATIPATSASGAVTREPALEHLIERVVQARAARTPLRIHGAGTKDFYGNPPQGDPLDVRALRGVSAYEPTELVVTARAGTPLLELEALLAGQGQCLPFEPPRHGPGATLGGMVASGLSGPARPRVGSVRDHLLGASMLDGRGEVLSFGGQVIKNVAGYDVSRLLAGSLGILGVILEVSLKVLPLPHASTTLRFELDQAAALARLHAWMREPLALDASAWWDGTLVVRLRGAEPAVRAAAQRMGGETVESQAAEPFWNGLRDQSDEFFARAAALVAKGGALWRLSLPATAPPLKLDGETLVEWHGAQRWLATERPAHEVRAGAAAVGGHATLFRAIDKSAGTLAPLAAPLERIHRELKRAFDPDGIFNPGRLIAGL
ncbi:MAG TPA: glycolate oxidase subunit GlcE [Caldimonas sp.]|nr:glycolate oxidase subunit GlcE [Caldimonas sp.]